MNRWARRSHRRFTGRWAVRQSILLVALGCSALLAPPAQADPGCQDGVLIVWARGSSQNFTDHAQEFNAFKDQVGAALGSTPHADVQLGNVDGDGVLEANEYPAVGGAQYIVPGYFNSERTGRNELIEYLNRRAANCPREAYVLGGYSQGADVMGDAVLLEGYGDINDQTRQHIAVVALYGDPSHYAGRGLLTPRPLPDWLTSTNRIGSWCDVNDSVCRAMDINLPWTWAGNSHGWIYAQRYIPDTAGWIATKATAKVAQLGSSNPVPAPPARAPVFTPPPPTIAPPTARTYREQMGSWGAGSFANYHNASGIGPRVAPGQWVDVACKVHDPFIQSVNPDGYWYRLASNPWNSQYYTPANTFLNGDPIAGPFKYPTDWNVPDC